MSFLSLVCVLMLGMALRIQAYEATDGEAAQTAVFTWLLFFVSVMVFLFCLYQMMTDMIDQFEDAKTKAKMGRRMSVAAFGRAGQDVDLLYDADAVNAM